MLLVGTVILLIISTILLILLIRKSKQVKKLTATYKNNSTLIDAINLPIFYKDKDGKFIGSNKFFDKSFSNFKKKL